MLAMLWGGAGGLEGLLRRNFNGFATNMGACFPQRTTMSYKGYNKGMTWQLNDADISIIRRISPYIDLSSTMGFDGATIKYGTKSNAGRITGVEGDYFKMQIPVLYDGRLINSSDVSQSRKVVVLGKDVADELFANESPIGKYVSVNNLYFLVIGVAGQKSEASIGGRINQSAIIPATTMRSAFNKGDKVDFFVYTARPGYTPKDIEPAVRRAVIANHPLNPADKEAMWFMDISEEFKKVDYLFLGINILALFVGVGTLLAGIIGIGNIMWIIVKERTQEIGIRRAIGAKPSDIITQILSESMVLTTIAGIAGICFATLVLSVADHITYDPRLGSAHFQLPFFHALAILITFLILGTAAGIIPAIKAMRIKPIEAMNDK